jgi:hypothetical protein
VEEQFKPQNLELFGPVTQEHDWNEFLQQSTQIQAKIEITVLDKSKLCEVLFACAAWYAHT